MDYRLRFADLKARGIVKNRVTLSNWIKNQGFPPGQLTGPNTRTWGSGEIDEYVASRPTEPKPTPNPKDIPNPQRPRGRRKQREQAVQS
jgi:hypothetical protein